MRCVDEPALVLHQRPYRETSQLVDLFSRHHGRFTAVVRGVRGRTITGGSGGAKRRRANANMPLGPFVPLLVSWQGRGDLKSLTRHELSGSLALPKENHLYAGFYVNELLLRLLLEGEAHELLFDRYISLLEDLADAQPLEPLLRRFEFFLLSQLGYGINFSTDCKDYSPLSMEAVYRFDPERGFSRHFVSAKAADPYLFSGDDISSVADMEFDDPRSCRAGKRLARLALGHHLGHQPLKTRELFAQRQIVRSAPSS